MKLVWLVRLGIGLLGAAIAVFIASPATLNAVASPLPLHGALTELLQRYPGFDHDWRAIVSLTTVSAYVYGYLVVVLVVSNVIHPAAPAMFQGAEGRYRWHLMSLAVVGVGRPASSAVGTGLAGSSDNFFSVVRDYSRSREGLGSLAYSLVGAAAATYIGYRALLRPSASEGLPAGVFARVVDAVLVGFWCYCVFLIVLWLVLVLVGWLQLLGGRS